MHTAITKTILAMILAACGADSTAETSEPPTDQPDKLPPDPPIQEDQHFCCASVDVDKLSGEDCIPISAAQILACSEVLYCEGSWATSKGTTKCAK